MDNLAVEEFIQLLQETKKSPCIPWTLSEMPRLFCPTFGGQYTMGLPRRKIMLG